MTDLLLDKRNEIALREEDFLKSVPVPAKTNSYSPVSHSLIIDTIGEGLKDKGFHIKSKQYNHSKYGQQLIGQYALGTDDPTMGMMVAFRNSYDKSMSLGFATGANVWICGNGMISGELTHKRKHTGDAQTDILNIMGESLGLIDLRFNELQHDKGLMEDHSAIDKRCAAELLGRMVCEEEILNTMQMNIIRKEMDVSEDFKFNGSVWNFYNNCTEALKKSHPTSYLNSHIDLHEFFMEDVMA